MSDPSTPKTFIRGLRIMEAIQRSGPSGLRIPEIAARTGVQRSTIYRYLSALLDMGYVHGDETTQRYIFNDSRFAGPSTDMELLEALKSALRRISDATGDSSFLVRREHGDSLCVHRELGDYPLQVLAVTIGHRQPMGVGAAGLALISYLHKTDIQEILTMSAARLPEFGGMTRKNLERLISATCERGWSVVGNAAVPGVIGVGVPIAHHGPHPIYAVSVSSVMARMQPQRQRFVVDVIRRELASALAEKLVNSD